MSASKKYGAEENPPSKKVHQNILCRFEWLIMSAGFDERLLCQNLLDRIPCFRWDVLQMVIYIYTNKITQPHAGADKRRKTASVFTAVQLHIVCFPGRQRITLADNRTGFIGDLPLPNCLLKKADR